LSVPVQGWVAPLEETPDPVFAERMLGDGLAIDPTVGALFAPCDGVIVSVHRARHALTLRAANGAEILMHVGLETVALGGEGFSAKVEAGREVKAGDLLLGFDLDLIARRARSLITPIVIANSAEFEIVTKLQDRAAKVGDPLMELRRLDARSAQPELSGGLSETRRAVTIPMAHGIHARPAARIGEALKGLDAEVAILLGDRRANARSAIALMGLATRCGDRIEVAAKGAQAEAAVTAVCTLIESGIGEAAPHGAHSAEVADVPPPAPLATSPFGPPSLRGVPAAPGLAIGRAVNLVEPEIAIVEAGAGEAVEGARLQSALDRVRSALIAAIAADTRPDSAGSGILSAHLALLDDPDLADVAARRLAGGKSAEAAWRAAIGGQVQILQASGDRRMAERAADLVDLERRVLRTLSGAPEADRSLAPGSVVLADELLPSDLMGLDASKLAALCTARGGPTSHVAILAAALGVPMVVAAGPSALTIGDGATLIIDADLGAIWVAPDADALGAAQTALAERQARRAAALAAAHTQCRMADGTRIEVFANIGSLADAQTAVKNGAEGSGLLRTEFLFLDRDTAPDEDEQLRQYQAIASALEGRPLIIRTLDVGGDKAAPYLPIPAEENPALGLRGVRVSLWKPELLKTQLRAILRVEPRGQCKIMVPMVADLSDLRAVRRVLDEAKQELGVTDRVELGVMVETPAAAVTADLLASEADFLSIGTNDLTQYVLAMDRGNPEVAARIDALHPAVLRLIHQTCQGAARHGRWTGVCGGLASDVLAAPILIGLGVVELSTTVAVGPDVKARVRSLKLDDCQALAREALDRTSPQAVRALAAAFLKRD
jgi:phosphocarrier protein FPr/phosphocarrier protein